MTRPETDPNHRWAVGMRCAIDRMQVCVVEAASASGRPTANGRTFHPDGTERTSASRRSRLEAMTPEIEAEMALVARGKAAKANLDGALDEAKTWLGQSLPTYGPRVPGQQAVEDAEAMAGALRAAMQGPSKRLRQP